MKDYQDKLGGLADKLKKDRPPTPLQEVQPIKIDVPTEPDVQFNNRIPKGLLKDLKRYSVDQDISLKDINTDALKLYLKTNSKQPEDQQKQS